MRIAPPPPKLVRILDWIVRVVAAMWAGAWSVLVVLSTLGSDERGLLLAAVAIAAACVPVVIAWAFPRVGAALLLGVAGASGALLGSGATLLSLTIPAMVIGMAFALTGVWTAQHRRASSNA